MAAIMKARTVQQLSTTNICGHGLPSSSHRLLIPSRISFASAGEALWQKRYVNVLDQIELIEHDQTRYVPMR